MPIPSESIGAAASRNAGSSPTSPAATKLKSMVNTHETHPTVLEKDKSIHPEHGVIHYPFYFGGVASCVSVCCTQPLGVAGLRLQTHDHKSTHLGMKGLGASLTRTVIYSGLRFGIYEKLKEMSTTPTHTPTAPTMAAFAACSGVVGSLSSNFADIVCLRMQRDPGLPIHQRRNYKNMAHGVVKMITTEGWGSIWTGAGVGAGRAAMGTATQLAGYDIFKRELMKRTSLGDDIPLHIASSCLAGFLSTFLCSPLDVFKARVMTQNSTNSVPTMLKHMFKTEGLLWMYRGLTPALISRGPSTIITFVAFEQLKKAYRRAHGLET
ncbi:related to dicarboxylate carrier protein [Ramularia collo-cygni]|uniref:Related to dicarboxylate carrier protein n=1 Tax=Ramularia collo-cygni TaxID=112498 RepID=A0A2D3UWJ6_9PEZI|nr:related to dicarboxylate carrier protein [Ramularia collo-cygni]CZT18645.1 related to dicarboxylate carrier protein [Ramularia collo-cygni]